MRETIQKLLTEKENKLCVISTSVHNQPWSAVVGYVVSDDGTVIVSTHTSSRKWKDISQNSKVSIVIGFSFNEPYIQAEGIARLIEEGEEYQHISNYFYSVNPHAKQFASDDTAFIAINLTNVRLTDLSVSPPKVTEESFS